MKTRVYDELDGVTTFVQVVEAGGFAAAAQSLNLTRSAVGKAIGRLESKLGVRLLHRSTRSQKLTADGQAYYERCVRALAELNAAREDLEYSRTEPSGRLRVSVPDAFGHLCAAPVLLDLTRRYPQLQVEISFSDRYVDLIEEGFDLAVRIGDLPDSGQLAARQIGIQHIAIGASPAYLKRHGTPTRWAELDGHTAIEYSRAGSSAPWVESASRGRRIGIRTTIRLDDIQAVAAAAVDGFGLAWLPSWLLSRYIRSGQLLAVLGSRRVRSQAINAVWPQARRQMRAKTRVAIDALVARIPELMGAQPREG